MNYKNGPGIDRSSCYFNFNPGFEAPKTHALRKNGDGGEIRPNTTVFLSRETSQMKFIELTTWWDYRCPNGISKLNPNRFVRYNIEQLVWKHNNMPNDRKKTTNLKAEPWKQFASLQPWIKLNTGGNNCYTKDKNKNG